MGLFSSMNTTSFSIPLGKPVCLVSPGVSVLITKSDFFPLASLSKLGESTEKSRLSAPTCLTWRNGSLLKNESSAFLYITNK